MEMILKSDVAGLGKALELVHVKPGFAQNFLLPKKLAVLATNKNKQVLEQDRARAEAIYLKEKKDAEGLSEKLRNVSITIAARIVEGEKLYGSVTGKEIAAKLKDEGFEIDRKQIDLEEPIKNLGMYTVKINLPPDVEARIKLWVISDESHKVKA